MMSMDVSQVRDGRTVSGVRRLRQLIFFSHHLAKKSMIQQITVYSQKVTSQKNVSITCSFQL